MKPIHFHLILGLFALDACISSSAKSSGSYNMVPKALLATNYKSLSELNKILQFQYGAKTKNKDTLKSYVNVSYQFRNTSVNSYLESGIDQNQIIQTKESNFYKKLEFTIKYPSQVRHRKDYAKIYEIARRLEYKYGVGDVAFYDLALASVSKIKGSKIVNIPHKNFGEKGYINSINHITAQALITAIFSEKHADFIADVHERLNMPELTTGKFLKHQLKDTNNFPVDNYVDLINNEIGQELGNQLKKRYNISTQTYWTPNLLVSVLNDIQTYYSWSFKLNFGSFNYKEPLITNFCQKLNTVLTSS